MTEVKARCGVFEIKIQIKPCAVKESYFEKIPTWADFCFLALMTEVKFVATLWF